MILAGFKEVHSEVLELSSHVFLCFNLQPDKTSGTIKDQLAAIAPALEQLWKQKEERIKEFFNVQSQIQKICGEIAGTSEQVGSPVVDEADLSLKKLEEFQSQLHELQKEKVILYLITIDRVIGVGLTFVTFI